MSEWKSEDFIGRINTIALRNCKVPPQDRRGLIVPHNPEQYPLLKGKKTSVPEELTDIFDLELGVDLGQRIA